METKALSTDLSAFCKSIEVFSYLFKAIVLLLNSKDCMMSEESDQYDTEPL